jgi:hypothetical protein
MQYIAIESYETQPVLLIAYIKNIFLVYIGALAYGMVLKKNTEYKKCCYYALTFVLKSLTENY